MLIASVTEVFITGTDTDVGKTYVSMALMSYFKQHGYTVSAMKPVASGCIDTGQGLQNNDALQLQSLSSSKLNYAHVNPYAFAPAIAPHLAAELAGVSIDFAIIKQQAQLLKHRHDVLIIEGVGGCCVPLGRNGDVIDLINYLNIPAILVVGIKLGCLNHARLTAMALKSRGVSCVAWVANQVNPDTEMQSAQLSYLQETLDIPYWGCLPYINSHQHKSADSLATALSKGLCIGS